MYSSFLFTIYGGLTHPGSKSEKEDGGLQSSHSSVDLCFFLDLYRFCQSTKRNSGLLGRAQRCQKSGRSCQYHVERNRSHVRAELRQYAEKRLQPCALHRTIRGKSLLGERKAVDGSRGSSALGQRKAVLQLHREHLRAGEGLRALHAGGVAQVYEPRLRPRQLHHRRHIHHLQLQSSGQLRRPVAVLVAFL